jgi:hypothetical protein
VVCFGVVFRLGLFARWVGLVLLGSVPVRCGSVWFCLFACSFVRAFARSPVRSYFLELYLSKYGIFNQGKFETYRIKQVEKDSLGFLKEISPNHISGKQLGFVERDSQL